MTRLSYTGHCFNCKCMTNELEKRRQDSACITTAHGCHEAVHLRRRRR